MISKFMFTAIFRFRKKSQDKFQDFLVSKITTTIEVTIFDSENAICGRNNCSNLRKMRR